MNKYLGLVEDILNETYEHKLNWEQVPICANAALIQEPWNVIRQFQAPYSYNGLPATLICVEKRIYVDEDYFFPYSDYMCELLIVQNGRVVELIAPPKLPWFWLKKFIEVILECKARAAEATT